MKMKQFFYFSSFLILTVVLSSCSKFYVKLNKLKKSNNWEEMYDESIKYYDDEKYYKSMVLMETVMPVIKGTKKEERALYYRAYGHFHQKLYKESAFFFKEYLETFSRSEVAEECNYMYAYSLYLDSPNTSLDQSNTMEAVMAMQSFIDRFPESDKRSDASKVIDELQVKLEEKGYANAINYHTLGYYKSALVAFDNFERDFPDSKLNENIRFFKIDAAYKLAEISVASKKKERYQAAVDHYLIFIDTHKASEYSQDAEKIYEESLSSIEKINKTES